MIRFTDIFTIEVFIGSTPYAIKFNCTLRLQKYNSPILGQQSSHCSDGWSNLILDALDIQLLKYFIISVLICLISNQVEKSTIIANHNEGLTSRITDISRAAPKSC